MTQRVFLIAVAALMLATAGSWVVEAAQAQAPTFSLGFVDLHRISDEYAGTKSSKDELDAYQQTLKKQLDDREAIRFLDDQEIATVNGLRTKINPSADEKKHLDNMLASSKSRGDQLRALQQNPNKTDAEKTEFDRLTRLSAKADDDLNALGTTLDDQLKTKADQLSKKLTDTVSAAIAQVAKEKSYTAVLDKQAVLSGGSDLTDDVLKQLTKK